MYFGLKLYTEKSIQITLYVSRSLLIKNKINLSELSFYHLTSLHTLLIDARRQLLATRHHGNPLTDKPPSALVKPQGLPSSIAIETADSHGLGAIAGWVGGIELVERSLTETWPKVSDGWRRPSSSWLMAVALCVIILALACDYKASETIE